MFQLFAIGLLVSLITAPTANTVEHVSGIVAGGERLELPENFVRCDTKLEATIEFDSFRPVQVGRGLPELYRSGWVEITETDAVLYDVGLVNKTIQEDYQIEGLSKTREKTIRARAPMEIARYQHGLDLKGVKSLTVSFVNNHETSDLTIVTSKGSFTRSLKSWFAGGAPFVRNLGTKPVSVNLDFDRMNAGEDIWFIGASYFSTISSSRFAYYMRKDGYTHFMADHLPGGETKQMLATFKHDLDFGTPKIVVWMMMANSKADTDTINPQWLSDTQEFIDICKAKGIEPVLTIYPKVKNKNHTLKSEWIRKSGYRYIDLFEAMCNDDGSWKKPEWLYKDNTHPTAEGAEVMWEAVHKALPEIR